MTIAEIGAIGGLLVAFYSLYMSIKIQTEKKVEDANKENIKEKFRNVHARCKAMEHDISTMQEAKVLLEQELGDLSIRLARMEERCKISHA